jgi:hypothetical protein
MKRPKIGPCLSGADRQLFTRINRAKCCDHLALVLSSMSSFLPGGLRWGNYSAGKELLNILLPIPHAAADAIEVWALAYGAPAPQCCARDGQQPRSFFFPDKFGIACHNGSSTA